MDFLRTMLLRIFKPGDNKARAMVGMLLVLLSGLWCCAQAGVPEVLLNRGSFHLQEFLAVSGDNTLESSKTSRSGQSCISDAFLSVSESLPSAAQTAGNTDIAPFANSWMSLLPPVMAIALALIFRQVFLALFAGVWMGAWLMNGMTAAGLFSSFFFSVTDYVIPSLADSDLASILVFSMMVGGMVGIIGANGGTRGTVLALSRLVTSRRRARLTTTGMGYLIFFDDYANTMVVGSAMRPLTDRFKISRAKLAYLVDSTAAPVAIIALISTWIGAVVGYIFDAQSAAEGFEESAYLIFLHSLGYNFYAFLAIILVLIVAWSGRDFGPMRRVEHITLKGRDPSAIPGSFDDENESKASRDDHRPSARTAHWSHAAIPVAALVLVTLGGLWATGEGDSVRDIVGSADSYAALVWGSVFSLFVACLLTLGGRLLKVEELLKGMFKGMHLMFEGMIILILAWSLGLVTQHMGTSTFLVSLLYGLLNPYWIPVVIFLLAGFTSFATGSSWGTMGIIMPLVLPLAWSLGASSGLDPSTASQLVYASVSAVLAGAVWGDHCSPISDTTILSSLACRCDHISHVYTQLPYALLAGALSILALISAVVFALPLWAVYPAAIAIMTALVYRYGQKSDADNREED